MLFDCQACGACCCNTAKNIARGTRTYVEVTPTDKLFKHPGLRDQLAEPDRTGLHHMLLEGDEQRCIALKGELGVKVGCQIYHLRPQGCRTVEAGDGECLAARKALRARGVMIR